jgi:hypothetical protein
MGSERRNMPEQELSIREREQELFDEPQPQAASREATRPFADYLRETPADPLSTPTKVILWAVGIVVLILFIVAIVRPPRSARPGSRSASPRRASVAVACPPLPVAYPDHTRDGTMSVFQV